MDFARLFAALPARFLILTPDAPRFTILSASDSYLQATGTRLDEVVGRGVFDVFPEAPEKPVSDGPALLRNSLTRVHAEQVADRMPLVRYDIPSTSGDGFEERYWMPVNSPVSDAGGKLMYIVHRVEDATDYMRTVQASEAQRAQNESLETRVGNLQAELLRHGEEVHRANQQLVKSEHRYRSLVSNIAGMVYRVQAAPPWEFMYVSEGVERLCGHPSSYFLVEHNTWASVMLPEDAARVSAELAAQAAAGLPQRVEYRIRHRDGSVRWVEGRVRSVEGNAAFYEGTVFDIDDRKMAELRLHESQEDLRYTVQTVPSVLWTARSEGTLDFVSEAASEQIGIPAAELLETGWLDHLHPEDVERVSDTWHTSMTTGVPYATRFRMRDSQGEYHSFQIRAQCRRDSEGAIQRWYGVSTNVDEFQRAQARAEEASRAKSAFLSTMSHEIRTPLNAVLGFASLLADTELGVQQRDFVNSIRASGDHLLGVINDILDFSRLESSSVSLDYTACDVRRLVEQSLDLVASQAAPKNLELIYRIDDGVPEACLVDEARLRQVLANLLGNAVKFTSRGEVLVQVSAQPLPDGDYEFGFKVRDTGIGIPADRLDRLFRDFSQVDDSVSRRFGGTGLGLAISKRLVEAHRGVMEVSSEPGVGSSFGFRIPATACDSPAFMPAASPESLRGRRVLVVDDNRSNLEILELQTRAWGMDPVCLSDPHHAPEVVERSLASDMPFELAILDHEMPGLDGLALTRRLRQVSAMPIVLLTSLGTTMEDARASGASITAAQSKPVHRSALFETLCAVLQPRSASAPLARPEQGVPLEMPPLRLLVAEDNLVNRKVARLLLAKMGYPEIEVAVDGLEAVAALKRRSCDVVLMDVQMPNLDGLDATRRIRQEIAPDQQPQIIAMTANAMVEDRENCIAAGMDDYVSKPIDPAQLMQALLRAAERRGASSPALVPPTRRSPREDAETRARRIADQVLAGGGEMGALMRRIDWSRTPLGPVYTWPQSLRTVLSIVLTQKHPMFLWWGRELTQFYNDAYRPILGTLKHPAAMSQRGRECFAEIWDEVGPMAEAVMERGESCRIERGQLCMLRNGYVEEAYFSYGYSPIRDESGGTGGVLVVCSEVTADVIDARRSRVLMELGALLEGGATSWERVSEVLLSAQHDLPFMLLYRREEQAGHAERVCSTGLQAGGEFAPSRVRAASDVMWPLFDPAQPHEIRLVENIVGLPVLPPWPEQPVRALVLNVGTQGVAVFGLSPRLPLDDAYRAFCKQLVAHLARALNKN